MARGLSESVLAHLAASSMNDAEAMTRFDAARLRVSEGLLESQFGSQAYERWARAELLFRMGRFREALPWYASLAQISIDGMIYLAPAEARQAVIHEQLGDSAAAAMHYRRFLDLWGDANPEQGAWVAHARSRLEALR
jgi:tetratricopeptide (TPR) repeat protein